MVFDIFTENLVVMSNFIALVVQQQGIVELAEGIKPMKNDMTLIQISLNLCQKMMFQYPKLMDVLRQFGGIDQFFQNTFLKVENERIQLKVTTTFFEICKKLDQDLARLMLKEMTQQTTSSETSGPQQKYPDNIAE